MSGAKVRGGGLVGQEREEGKGVEKGEKEGGGGGKRGSHCKSSTFLMEDLEKKFIGLRIERWRRDGLQDAVAEHGN